MSIEYNLEAVGDAACELERTVKAQSETIGKILECLDILSRDYQARVKKETERHNDVLRPRNEENKA
jgi:hypothetical protein